MVPSISITPWALSYKKMVLSIKVLALAPLRKTGLQNRKIDILEVARALLFTSHMPSQFWGDSILTTTYLINRMPGRVLSFVTPLQKFQEFFPHSRLDAHLPLCVFGSTVFVHTHGPKWNKFDPRALKCVFLGYSSTQKGYKCYDPISQKLYVSLHAHFFSILPTTHFRGSLWVKLDHP